MFYQFTMFTAYKDICMLKAKHSPIHIAIISTQEGTSIAITLHLIFLSTWMNACIWISYDSIDIELCLLRFHNMLVISNTCEHPGTRQTKER